MIRRMRIKLVVLAMSALLVLLVVIVAGMNLVNYGTIVEEADTVLSLLSQNQGRFPSLGSRPWDRFPPELSPETPYESRYFTIFYNDEGQATRVDLSNVVSVDINDALNYGVQALEGSKARGFLDQYRYQISQESGGSQVTFLDCGRRVDQFRRFLWTSIWISLLGFAVVFVIFAVLSGRIIRPIADSYDKQKRFITDASHEIKTPLTIISANADLLEMELEEPSESLSDIKDQVAQLRHLTEDLVLLARMEEGTHSLPKLPFPVSDVVTETAAGFRTLAASQEKVLDLQVEPRLTLVGSGKSIRQLVSILLDNALKYAPAQARIALVLKKTGKSVCLVVSNPTKEPVTREQLGHVFDRFYRADASRNSATGGHGIGLSVAQAIVTAHGGKIAATTRDGKTFTITATFPV